MLYSKLMKAYEMYQSCGFVTNEVESLILEWVGSMKEHERMLLDRVSLDYRVSGEDVDLFGNTKIDKRYIEHAVKVVNKIVHSYRYNNSNTFKFELVYVDKFVFYLDEVLKANKDYLHRILPAFKEDIHYFNSMGYNVVDKVVELLYALYPYEYEQVLELIMDNYMVVFYEDNYVYDYDYDNKLNEFVVTIFRVEYINT